MNVWTDTPHIQGLLALTDHTPDSGGFICVPMLTADNGKLLEEWKASNSRARYQKGLGSFISLPSDDKLYFQKKKICFPAGSFLAWDSRTAHCNYPNSSDSFRMVQYIRLVPSNSLASSLNGKKLLLKAKLANQEIDENESLDRFPRILTLLGERLHGLTPW